MKNNRKVILLVVGLAILTSVLAAIIMYNKGPVDVAESEALDVDPVSLFNSYITDSVKAHKKFDGKIITLTGEVSGVTKNIQEQQVILIKTSMAGGNINCTMEKPPADIVAGSNITVKGICNGIGQGDADLGIAGDVYLTRAIIVK